MESYTAPYDGDAPTSRYARTYDALLAATEFAHGGTTSAANLQPLCSVHNRLKYRRTTRSRTGKKTRAGTGTGPGAKAPPDGKGPPGAVGPPTG